MERPESERAATAELGVASVETRGAFKERVEPIGYDQLQNGIADD